MKICCCFALKAPTGLSWPGIGADYEARKKHYVNLLQENFGAEYEFVFVDRTAQASDEELRELTVYDGFLMILLAHGTGLGQRMAGMLKHGLIIDDPFGGSGDIIRVANVIKDNNFPLNTVGTTDEEALLQRIRTYLAVPKIQNSRILVFKNFEKMSKEKEAEMMRSIGTGSTIKRYRDGKAGFDESVRKVRDTFGIEVITKTLKDLHEYLEGVDVEEAKLFAKKWIDNADAVVEPKYEDVLESAKLHLALEKAKVDTKADVVSVDCILLFFAYDLDVYPCMSFFEMNSNGEIGICEGDLDSSISSLMIRAISNRPGFVSDPFVDTEKNEILYAHCVASCRPLGPGTPMIPYRIRTHAEDDASSALQVIMPEGYPLTTIKVSTSGKAMSIHSGKSVGNIDCASGCRTKLVCQVNNSKRIMDNWHNELFSWHRVTVFGDYRKELIEVANYLGLKVYEEDKEEC